MHRTVQLTNKTIAPAIVSQRGNMNECRVEIRVIFPPQATKREIMSLIERATTQAKATYLEGLKDV